MHTRELVKGRWVNSFQYTSFDLKERLKEEKVTEWSGELFNKAMKLHPKSCSMAAQYIKRNKWK